MAEDKPVIVEKPFGKLVQTLKTDKAGKTIAVTYRGSTGDLRDWDHKEFGIDDKMRDTFTRRNVELTRQMSDFMTEKALEHKASVSVALGMGDGAEVFEMPLMRETQFPVKNADGTTGRGHKTIIGEMRWETQRLIPKEIREHHAINQVKIEEMVNADMEKATVK